MPVSCPRCGATAPDGARFCEVDGARLLPDEAYASASASGPAPPAENPAHVTVAAAPAPPLLQAASGGCRCGAGPDAEAEGYCSACGRKWVAPRKALPRDHVEAGLSDGFGGVTDRGQRHEVNEDDMALALVPGEAGAALPVIVVCDGVSSSDNAQRASAIAARTACDRLAAAYGGPALSAEGVEAAFRDAVAAANQAVCALHASPASATSDPPETTLVAAVVTGRTASVAWVGDSRAYWIDARELSLSRLLTHDHSWVNDVVDSGQMPESEAQKNRLAHAITRCLGPSDDAGSQEPSLAAFDFPDGHDGYLLLCTDGLWNYAPEPAALAALVSAVPTGEGAVGIARSLVAWANEQGGRDNISAALWRACDAQGS